MKFLINCKVYILFCFQVTTAKKVTVSVLYLQAQQVQQAFPTFHMTTPSLPNKEQYEKDKIVLPRIGKNYSDCVFEIKWDKESFFSTGINELDGENQWWNTDFGIRFFIDGQYFNHLVPTKQELLNSYFDQMQCVEFDRQVTRKEVEGQKSFEISFYNILGIGPSFTIQMYNQLTKGYVRREYEIFMNGKPAAVGWL